METRRKLSPTSDHVHKASNGHGSKGPYYETTRRHRFGNNSSGGRYSYRQAKSASSPSTQPARYRRNIERRQNAEIESRAFTSQKFVPSLGFDLRRLQSAHSQKTLSLYMCCTKCVPSSRTKFIEQEYVKSGLQDVLAVNRSSVRGIMGWIAPYAGWVLQTPVLGPLHDPQKPVFESDRVQEAIDKAAVFSLSSNGPDSPLGTKNTRTNGRVTPVPTSKEVALKQQRSKAKSIIIAMSGPIYGWVLRLTSYALFWVLRKLFRHLYVQRSHIRMLKAAQEKDVPIIFLPSHKSHVDYLLLTFVLLNVGIKVPHIAAGANLNIPIFSWFIHHLGGWFIRRRLDSGSGRDQLYRNILHEYMEQLLKTNQNMEFYIEGSRSRTGKPSLPKAGLLSVLVDAIREGAVQDILLVPCSISYDRIVERNFIRHELMGGSKRPENFLKGLKGIWALLTKSVGCVRIDFAQPFSLHEYLSVVQVSTFSPMALTHPSTGSLLTPGPAHSSAERRVITALSYHLVYDFINCASIMSTNIVGFLLLTRFRHGVRISDLIESYSEVERRVTRHGRAVGFPGSSSESVHYALNYLRHLTRIEKCGRVNGMDESSTSIIFPKLTLPDVFELLHHTNQVIPIYILEAITACSLAIICEEEDDDSGSDRQIEVAPSRLIEEGMFLSQIFGREFIYSPPCMELSSALYTGIESLTTAEIFSTVQSSQSATGRCRASWSDTLEDEEVMFEEPMLKVDANPKSLAYLSFLKSILGSYTEGYWNVAVQLDRAWQQQQHSDNPQPCPIENEFLNQIHKTMVKKHSDGLLIHVESCSMDILRNSLKSLTTMEVVCVDSDGRVVVIDHPLLTDIISVLTLCKI